MSLPRAVAAADCPLPMFGPGSEYRPRIDPANFSATVDNPRFPLRPGRTLVYSGTKDGRAALDIASTQPTTVEVAGVATRPVVDRLYLDGILAERTTDYYAQDRCGNVWYFGEDTAELDRQGHVLSTSGSFRAGVGGGQAGVVMEASPTLGRRFRQEWLRGEAEDTYVAVSLGATVRVPFGHFTGALRTRETTALEPGVVDEKVYASGLGTVMERSLRDASEQLVLVDVVDPIG